MSSSRSRGAWARGLGPALAALLALAPATVRAELSESRRLLAATARLVPYDLEGATLEALRELATLSGANAERVSTTARFLRLAAATDLVTFGVVTGSSSTRQAVADALGVDASSLHATLEQGFREISGGSFTAEADSYSAVSSCLSSVRTQLCSLTLRRVANSSLGASTAARLLLVGESLQGIERARLAPPAQIARTLAEAVGRSCDGEEAPLASCDAGGDLSRLGRELVTQSHADLEALRRAGEGDDPLVVLAADWLTEVQGRVGWLALPEPLAAEDFSLSSLPRAASPAALPPLELLIIDSRGASVALSPVLAIGASGVVRLDAAANLGLPGRSVLPEPFGFRAVIRPIPQVTEALRRLRRETGELIERQGDLAPAWLGEEQRTLGLIVDSDMMLADLARFVWSAQDAGYERFALFGRRDDGRLAVISVVTSDVEHCPSPAQLPRISVGPREIRVNQGEGPVTEFERNDSSAGSSVASLLAERSRSFAIHGTQPWMTYGLVFPTIDAVMASVSARVERCLLLLPR